MLLLQVKAKPNHPPTHKSWYKSTLEEANLFPKNMHLRLGVNLRLFQKYIWNKEDVVYRTRGIWNSALWKILTPPQPGQIIIFI